MAERTMKQVSAARRRVSIHNPHKHAAQRAAWLTAAAVAAVAVTAAVPTVRAANFNWDPAKTGTATGGGTGTWDAVNNLWFDGTSDVIWPNTSPNGDTALFGGALGT